MAKKKTPETSQIEEIDLSSIDIDSLAIPELGEDLSFLKIEESVPEERTTKKSSKPKATTTKKSEKSTKTEKSEKNSKKSDEENDEEFDFAKEFGKDDLDFDADFDFKDDFDDDFEIDDAELAEIEKDGYKAPKDFFTDKRRQKNLKKFLDVEVPAEFLEGLDEKMQLLFKKGKAEGKLVYDEVMSSLPVGDDIEFMDEVFSRLAKLGIELVDSLDQDDVFKDSGKKIEEIDLADISDDSVRMYLNEIGRFKLIDGDEETRLGRLIQK